MVFFKFKILIDDNTPLLFFTKKKKKKKQNTRNHLNNDLNEIDN